MPTVDTTSRTRQLGAGGETITTTSISITTSAETMNRYDEQFERPADDFWGGQADWSHRAEPTAEHERFDAAAHWAEADATDTRPAARLRRSWSKLMSGGVNATREHGIVRPDTVRPDTVSSAATPEAEIDATMFDDFDEELTDARFSYDDSYDDTSGWPTTTVPVVDATRFQHEEQPTDDAWDAEFAPAPIGPGHDRRPPGVDPLLVRFGAVAVVAALVVPLLLNARSDDTDFLVGAAETTQVVESTITLLPSTETVPTVPDATTTQLDPNDLPPAVPVNDSTSSSPSSQALSTLTASNDAVAPVAADVPSGSGALATAAATSEISTSSTATTSATANDAASADEPAQRVARNCAIDYTVVRGDYWIRLAGAAGVDLDELLEANGASVTTPLFVGTVICLPAGSTTPAPPTTQAPATTAAPTTTAAPPTTVASTAPPAAPNTSATADEVKQIIRDVWPDELEERALEIAFRESRYVPTAKNFCCYGVFQIYWNVHKVWLDDIGITNDQQLYDPATNARAAFALYQRAGGWGPWAL